MAAGTLGAGSYRVYVPFEMYYAGREFGWRMFREAGDGNAKRRAEIWQSVDHVFLSRYDNNTEAEKTLKALGFEEWTQVLASTGGRMYQLGPMRSGNADYGPLRLFSRPAAKKPDR